MHHSLTRMFVTAMLCLATSLAFAGGTATSGDTMKDDGMMAEDTMEKAMEKDDMATDMDQGMKEDAMDTMDDMEKAEDMKTMPMEDKMMDDKDSMK